MLILLLLLNYAFACEPPKYCPDGVTEYTCPDRDSSNGTACAPRCESPNFFKPYMSFEGQGDFETCVLKYSNVDCAYHALRRNYYQYTFSNNVCCFGAPKIGFKEIYSITQCDTCQPGQEYVDDECKPCQEGYFSEHGEQCKQCDFSSLPSPGGIKCREENACDAGTGWDGNTCAECTNGFSNDGAYRECQCHGLIQSGECKPCPGEWDGDKCVSCQEGYRSVNGVCICYGDVIDGVCNQCHGTVTPEGCKPCEEDGMFWDGEKCITCPFGTYRDGTECVECDNTRPECVSGILSRHCTKYSHLEFIDLDIYKKCGGRDAEDCNRLDKCWDELYRSKCPNTCYGLFHNEIIERFGHQPLRDICPECAQAMNNITIYEKFNKVANIQELGNYKCTGKLSEAQSVVECAAFCNFDDYTHFTFDGDCTCLDSPCYTEDKSGSSKLYKSVKYKFLAKAKCHSYGFENDEIFYMNNGNKIIPTYAMYTNVDECAQICKDHDSFLMYEDLCICEDSCPLEQLTEWDADKYTFFTTESDSFAIKSGDYCGEKCLRQWEGSDDTTDLFYLKSFSLIPNRCPEGQGRHITKSVQCTPTDSPAVKIEAFNKDECMLKCITQSSLPFDQVRVTFDGECLCDSCVDDQALAYHEGRCQTCEPGTYSEDFMPTCKVCRGKATTKTCKECDYGFAKLENDRRVCGDCQPGEEYDYETESCVPCQGNTYSDGTHACKTCHKLSAGSLHDRCSNECLPGSDMCICDTSRAMAYDDEGQSTSKSHTFSGEPSKSPGLCMTEDYYMDGNTRKITPPVRYDLITDGECRGVEARVYPDFPSYYVNLTAAEKFPEKVRVCYEKCVQMYPSYPGFIVYELESSYGCYCELENVGSSGCGSLYNTDTARRYDIIHSSPTSAYDQCQKNECVPTEELQNERQYWRTRALSNLFPSHFASPFVTDRNVKLMQKLGFAHYNKFNSHHENGMKGDHTFEDLHISLGECDDYAKRINIETPKTTLDWFNQVNSYLGAALYYQNDNLIDMTYNMFKTNDVNTRGTCFYDRKLIHRKFIHKMKCGSTVFSNILSANSMDMHQEFPRFKQHCEQVCDGKKYMSINIETIPMIHAIRAYGYSLSVFNFGRPYADISGVPDLFFTSKTTDFLVGACSCSDECSPSEDTIGEYLTFEQTDEYTEHVYFVPVLATKTICGAIPLIGIDCIVRMPTIEQQNTYIIDYINTTGEYAGRIEENFNPMQCPSYEGGCLCKMDIQYEGEFYDHHGYNMTKYGLETEWNGDERVPVPWEPYEYLYDGYCTTSSFLTLGPTETLSDCSKKCANFDTFVVTPFLEVIYSCYCGTQACDTHDGVTQYKTYKTRPMRKEWRMCDDEQECNNGCVAYLPESDHHDTFADNCMNSESISPSMQYVNNVVGGEVKDCHMYTQLMHILQDETFTTLPADFVYNQCCGMWDLMCSDTDLCFQQDFFNGESDGKYACGQTTSHKRCSDKTGTIVEMSGQPFTCEDLGNRVCFPSEYNNVYLEDCKHTCFSAYHDCSLHTDNAENLQVYEKCFESVNEHHPNVIDEDPCAYFIEILGGLMQCNSPEWGEYLRSTCPQLCYGLDHNKIIPYVPTRGQFIGSLEEQCLFEDYWDGGQQCSDMTEYTCQNWEGTYQCCKKHCDSVCQTQGCGHSGYSRRLQEAEPTVKPETDLTPVDPNDPNLIMLDKPTLPKTDTPKEKIQHQGRTKEDLKVNITIQTNFTHFDRTPWVEKAREKRKQDIIKYDGKPRRLNENTKSYSTSSQNSPTEAICPEDSTPSSDQSNSIIFDNSKCRQTCEGNDTHVAQKIEGQCEMFEKINCYSGKQIQNHCECNEGFNGEFCQFSDTQCLCADGQHCEDIATVDLSNFHIESPVNIAQIDLENCNININDDTYELLDNTILPKEVQSSTKKEILFGVDVTGCSFVLIDIEYNIIHHETYTVQKPPSKQCVQNVCACEGGEGARGHKCPQHQNNNVQVCEKCGLNYIMVDNKCVGCNHIWYDGSCREDIPECAYINNINLYGPKCTSNYNKIGDTYVYNGEDIHIEDCIVSKEHNIGCVINNEFKEIKGIALVQNGTTLQMRKQSQVVEENILESIMCPPGTYIKDLKCVACETGTFSYTYNMQKCETCAGAVAGATNCTKKTICNSLDKRRFVPIYRGNIQDDCPCEENRIDKLFVSADCNIQAPQFDITKYPNTTHYTLTRKSFVHDIEMSMKTRGFTKSITLKAPNPINSVSFDNPCSSDDEACKCFTVPDAWGIVQLQIDLYGRCQYLPSIDSTDLFNTFTITSKIRNLHKFTDIKVEHQESLYTDAITSTTEPLYLSAKHFVDYIKHEQGCNIEFIHAVGDKSGPHHFMNIQPDYIYNQINIVREQTHIELQTATSQCILFQRKSDRNPQPSLQSSYAMWNSVFRRKSSWARDEDIFMDLNNDGQVTSRDQAQMLTPIKCYLHLEKDTTYGVNDAICKRFLANTLITYRTTGNFKYN